MHTVYPDIFKNFVCKGSECKDNCCKMGWDIEIDDDTYKFYNNLQNELGNKLISHINNINGCHYMEQKNGCAFMNENGLCSVQLQYGEEHISEICREHPRFYEWFGDYKECGVGLCCEKTCELLLTHHEPLEFYSEQTDEQTDDLEYDEFVFENLLKVRNYILDILRNRKYTLTARLEFLFRAGEILQQGIDYGDTDEFVHSCKKLLNLSPYSFEPVSMEIKAVFSKDTLAQLEKFEYMHVSFPELVKETLGNIDKIPDILIKDYPYIWEHLAVYFTYRYFLKSARDFEISKKINFALKSITAIYLILAQKLSEKGTLYKDDFIFIIKEYSKEVEYSDNEF